MSILGMTHIGICVSDPARSRQFYQEVLGFTPVSEIAIDGQPTATLLELDELELRCLFLERDGVRIELMHHPVPGCVGDGDGTPMNQRGLTHLAFRVDDLAGTLDRVREAGGRVVESTHVANEDYQAEVVMVLDPDGVRLEFVEGPGDVFAPLGTPVAK